MKEKLYCIYIHTSPSGKSYIGLTKRLKIRERQHQTTNKCPAFRNAIDKYGWNNFIHEILEENLTLEEANIFEELYIAEYNTLSPYGYNLKSGGLNNRYSEETCQKIREANIGTIRTEESKRKQSESNMGKKHTQETIDKMKVAQLGEKHPMFGKKHTQEALNNMSINSSGEKHPNFGKRGKDLPNSKKWIITFPDGHEEIIIGLVQFCEEYGLLPGNMCAVARGLNGRKQHKGFKCRYFIEEITEEELK